MSNRPLLLVVLDGWGNSEQNAHNAIRTANTPNWDRYWHDCPHTLIACSGAAVGLPEGQMGNSEVGHMHIGAGRTIYQELTRIDKAIETGEFAHNAKFIAAIDDAIAHDKALHIMGLLSPGGVHSHERHIKALIDLAASKGLKKIYLHAFLDGRDTPPKSAMSSIVAFEKQFETLGAGQFASVIGRFYAMDRDQRWERVHAAYDCIVDSAGVFTAHNAEQALQDAYDRDETDEFVQATHIEGAPAIEAGDSVIFMNFRADRARQLSQAMIDPNFEGFKRASCPKLAHFITLTQYASHIPSEVAFKPQTIQNSFGEWIAKQGLTQLRIAETEKYAHVTFFFNGGSEAVFPGEERILIPSPKVATYNLQPEMSAPELTTAICAAIEGGKHDVIICNYANPDMVGHTGDFDATVKALTCIDECLGRLESSLAKAGGDMIITADHGNCEQMFDEQTGQAHTAHTSTPVPWVFVGRPAHIVQDHASLIDIAPTMLYLLGLPIPDDMTGQPIITLET